MIGKFGDVFCKISRLKILRAHSKNIKHSKETFIEDFYLINKSHRNQTFIEYFCSTLFFIIQNGEGLIHVHPPSTIKLCPVMCFASSETKNSAAFAISSTLAGRPIGVS